MIKCAILSDIHSNLEALTAVLADIHTRGIEKIYCLGDIVGYGPNPRECLDLAMEFECCVLGNHDQGALFDPEGFSRSAERAIFWTREQLEKNEGDTETDHPQDADRIAARWQFLGERPRNHREGNLLFVHGSPRNPLSEYIFPEDVYNTHKIEKVFEFFNGHCFQGHTHIPGVFTKNGRFLAPDELSYQFVLDSEKRMINVGSVGQPRDGDPRACYVTLEDEVVSFHRVEYPCEKTAEKIYAIDELENSLGDRIQKGK